MKEEIDAAKGAGHGAVGSGVRTLEDVVAHRGPSPERVVAGDVPSEAAILG